MASATPAAKPNYNYLDSRQVSRMSAPGPGPEEILAAELGNGFREYRRAWLKARAFEVCPPFPLQVDYELQFGCNLKCPMCPLSLPARKRSAYGRPGAGLPADLVKRLIDQGLERGQAALGFGGLWEPLLSPDLAGIVAYGRRKGLVDLMVNTNGQLLTPETSRKLIEAGLTRLMVSLDAASPETYARQRAGGNFAAVLANLESFLEIRARQGTRLPLLRVSFCRTALNQHELESFLAYWETRADFISRQNYGNFLAQAGEHLFPDGQGGPQPSGRCAQPWKRALIRHDGQVVLCCDVSGFSQPVGDIRRQSLAEIWAGPAARELRRAVYEGDLASYPACRACQSKFQPQGNDCGQPPA